MPLFDRYSRLRKDIREGKLLTGAKEILPHLSGRLSRADLPELLVEPGNRGELRAVIEFAIEKKMRLAITSGLRPAEVKNLASHLLILTSRLAAAPEISEARRTAHVDGGLSVESLAVDLARTSLRWPPLLPIPAKTSLGEMIALGWEGLRTWQDGGTLSHLRAVEWMAFDGTTYRSGPACLTENEPDVSGFLFGSRGAMGVITALELELAQRPAARSAILLELPDAHAAVATLTELRAATPLPETVVYWGEIATRILREGNDHRVSASAGVLLTVEWGDDVECVPEAWASCGKLLREETAIRALWEDLFRFPRTAARLYPERTGIRLKMPAPALPELEEAAADLGREFNLPVALWGTVESGQLQVWALQPDGESRTVQHAEELLRKLYEIALGLGARPAPGCVLPFDGALLNGAASDSPAKELRRLMLEKCDPHGLYS
ncbi:MAG: FAD-binding oxidoreductase, partial [bacterium]|nr:FAD-binding oxidoreductase [bacterium]